MKPILVRKNGFNIRALVCEDCKNQILHPEDLKEYSNFENIKKKSFKVKLRFVGNSYAVSIPREIIDFMNEQENEMNEMVDLCLEEIGRVSLHFQND